MAPFTSTDTHTSSACDSRVYEYLLPSYCLLPPATNDPFAKTLDETSPGWREVVKTSAAFVDAAPALEPAEGESVDPRARGEFERRRGWRCDADTLARFREIIAVYKGTHNFHNYTVGKPFNDSSVKRFMISIDVRDPTVYGDIEWISVRIHGQSFMLHQIVSSSQRCEARRRGMGYERPAKWA
jgi:tRNA pseudouridine38-40 synthase